ncbi:MAG: hypothetical protein J3R72DRAFT_462837, partial [Linnemannia gamsii]
MPSCPACLQEGHARSSSKACVLNPRRLATLVDQEARGAYIADIRGQSLDAIRGNIDAHDNPLPPPPVLGFAPPPPRMPRGPRAPYAPRAPHAPRAPREPPIYVPLARREFTEDLVTGADVVDGRHKIDRMISCPHCKARVWVQERTGGSIQFPLFSICCLKGRVEVQQIAADPELLEFISEQSAIGNAFRDNIRKYNSALS